MNTTPFYELHDRLYDRASAGCASIAEDFRLKRAVENMAPPRGSQQDVRATQGHVRETLHGA